MKKIKFILMSLLVGMTLVSCSRVAPNYQGVLMENFGQNGKQDFTLVKGRVSTMSPGTELFQAPLFKQRGDFSEMLNLKASNNTQFGAKPKYSYEVIESRAIDVVFASVRLDTGDNMMDGIEDNILEPIIDDLIKEFSRSYHTDSLMATGGQLKFEQELELAVKDAFLNEGLTLLTFQAQLTFSDKVSKKIDQRNEVNSNLTVLDRQIVEQRKTNELEELKTKYAKIKSEGLTQEILQAKFIDKWDGKTPLYGDSPIFYKKAK